ncbi:MAG TPA: ABC transporter permease subunit [Pseudonocardiaceae bacterium]|jgi:osmoprotectant transport system permease protein|nr:ABC transporter permease subunit [Pseudonocardiaceae bacterium]
MIDWLNAHWGYVLNLSGQHLYLAMVPVVIGFVASIPLGWLATRSGWVRGTIFYTFGFIYSIPSIALLTVLPAIFQTQVLDPVNLMIALTIYTAALMVRSVVDALTAVPWDVKTAATAMGFRPLRRFFSVDLPVSIPVLVAGLRVASVSSISLVSIGGLLGIGGLGDLFTDGFQTPFIGEIVVGVIASLVLALVMDLLLVLIGRVTTPWTRTG